MSYAIVIRFLSVALVATKRPPGAGIIDSLLETDLFGFTDATSNAGSVVSVAGAWARSAMTAPPTTIPAVANRSVLRIVRTFCINLQFFLRSDPGHRATAGSLRSRSDTRNQLSMTRLNCPNDRIPA